MMPRVGLRWSCEKLHCKPISFKLLLTVRCLPNSFYITVKRFVKLVNKSCMSMIFTLGTISMHICLWQTHIYILLKKSV